MKYVLITGAFGGMGSKAVEEFVKRGYTVFALDNKVVSPEKVSDSVIPLQVDITDQESVISAFNAIKAVTDHLHAIIHFAGVYMLNSLIEIEQTDFEKIFKINLFGAYLVNKTFAPLLGTNSRIIITTSELAPLAPLPFTGLYAVTKSALDKYAYSLRMEMQLLGVKVSVLRAGAVATGMLGVSTDALDRFCQNTNVYKCNAMRFKKIVAGVEAKNVSPQKIAEKTAKIIDKKNPKFAYSINRNKLLLLLNALPSRIQFWIIKKILK